MKVTGLESMEGLLVDPKKLLEPLSQICCPRLRNCEGEGTYSLMGFVVYHRDKR